MYILYSHTRSRSHMEIMVSFREIYRQLYIKITTSKKEIGKVQKLYLQKLVKKLKYYYIIFINIYVYVWIIFLK